MSYMVEKTRTKRLCANYFDVEELLVILRDNLISCPLTLIQLSKLFSAGNSGKKNLEEKLSFSEVQDEYSSL